MDRTPHPRVHTLLLGLLPIALGTLGLAVWVLPFMPGLAPFLLGWWVLGLGLGLVRWRRLWVAPALALPLALPPLVLTLAVNFRVVRVEGSSMLPSLVPGDVLLVDETAGPEVPLALYVVDVPGEKHNPLVKRLVGLPGAGMEVRYDRLFADDVEVHPRLGDAPDTWNEVRPVAQRGYVRRKLTLGPNEYFFLGDNPPESRDSRDFGPQPASAVIGRAVWCLRGSRGFGPLSEP